jgi:hypothetical protein
MPDLEELEKINATVRVRVAAFQKINLTKGQDIMKNENLSVKAATAKLVALINQSGNVGKTTIGSHMIAPRLPNLSLVAYIENTNQIPAPIGVVYGAHEFGDVEMVLLDACLKSKSCLIDFGASDFNTTVEMLKQYKAVKDRIDAFIIPCTPGKKEQIDTEATIDALIGLGVSPDKIRVLFNKVMHRDKPNLKRLFSNIFTLRQETMDKHGKTFFASVDATMFHAEIFKRLYELKMSLEEILADETDFEKAIMEESDREKKYDLAHRMSIKGLAENAEKTFDEVFEVLMKGV